MAPRSLVSGAVYGPETVKAILRAFDDAWAQIEHHFYDNPLAIEAARLKLANAVLSVAKEDSLDPEELKNLALQAMALHRKTDPALEVVMGQRVHSPRHWRSSADDALAIADQMTDPECKRLLVGIALAYSQLARLAAEEEAARGKATGTRASTLESR